MNKDLAVIFCTTCIRCSEELTNIFPLMLEHNPEWENEERRYKLGKIIYEIRELVDQLVYEDYPDIKVEMEKRMERFGRYF